MSEDEKNPVLRFFVHVVASVGVSKVISDVFKMNTIPKTKFDRLMIFTGTLVLGSIVLDYTAKHVEEKYQAVMAWWRKQREEINEN